jgi:hypothetical protein
LKRTPKDVVEKPLNISGILLKSRGMDIARKRLRACKFTIMNGDKNGVPMTKDDHSNNPPDIIDQIRSKHQAREILAVLLRLRRCNHHILRDCLLERGLQSSQFELFELLDRLALENLIRIEIVDDVRICELLERGREVIGGLEQLDWIARPEFPM